MSASKELLEVCDEVHDLSEIFQCPKEKCQHIGVHETGISTPTGCICICGNPNCKKMIEYKCGECGFFCLQPSCPIGYHWRPKNKKDCNFDIETRSCSVVCGEEEDRPLNIPIFEYSYQIKDVK